MRIPHDEVFDFAVAEARQFAVVHIHVIAVRGFFAANFIETAREGREEQMVAHAAEDATDNFYGTVFQRITLF